MQNRFGETLAISDEERIREVADYTCRLRYQGIKSDDQFALARLAAGTLPAAVVQQMLETAEANERGGTFTLYSAHDNTIMALLAHFGFRNFPIPSFAAFLALELHERHGQYYVRLLYNPGVWFVSLIDCLTF